MHHPFLIALASFAGFISLCFYIARRMMRNAVEVRDDAEIFNSNISRVGIAEDAQGGRDLDSQHSFLAEGSTPSPAPTTQLKAEFFRLDAEASALKQKPVRTAKEIRRLNELEFEKSQLNNHIHHPSQL